MIVIKQIFIVFLFTFCIFNGQNMIYAAGTDCDNGTKSRIDQFEVRTYLRVKDCDTDNASGSQQQVYFDDKNNSPLVSLILRTIEFATKIAGSIALLIIVIAGMMMISGVEEQMNKAKDLISAAVIGLALTFSSYIIVTFVQAFFY